MWLADAFNRYRLQRRKMAKQHMKTKDFVNKFDDATALEFVQHQCKGFEEWLKEHQSNERKQFMDKCQSAISVYFRRILIMPPMVNNTPPDTLIEDSILEIGGYMMQMFSLIDSLCLREDPNVKELGKTQPLPYQLDVVIIPKNCIRTDDDEDYSDDEDDMKNEGDGELGDIEARLDGEAFMKQENVSWLSATRMVKPMIDKLVQNQKFQRSVLIIDRRRKGRDTCYLYKPSDRYQCCMFEPDQTKFLPESLLINSRQCLIPPVKKTKEAKPISTLSFQTNPSFLTLQFHVYSADETRVYLSYDGWGTRFFIEDLRYYLPEFFVIEQRKKAESLFTDEQFKDFKERYEEVRKKCPDQRFEHFYCNLLNGKSNAKDDTTPH